MKCDKCEKEAVLHYQSNVNGERAEYHLCADCANKEGFSDMLSFRPRSMMDSFFSDPFFSRPMSLMDSFFGSPFGSLSDGFFGRGLLAPTLTMPNVRIRIDQPETCSCGDDKSCSCGEATKTAGEKADNIPEDAGEDIRKKRELHALKHQLKAAIHMEEFEKAAELRDKIRELEK